MNNLKVLRLSVTIIQRFFLFSDQVWPGENQYLAHCDKEIKIDPDSTTNNNYYHAQLHCHSDERNANFQSPQIHISPNTNASTITENSSPASSDHSSERHFSSPMASPSSSSVFRVPRGRPPSNNSNPGAQQPSADSTFLKPLPPQEHSCPSAKDECGYRRNGYISPRHPQHSPGYPYEMHSNSEPLHANHEEDNSNSRFPQQAQKGVNTSNNSTENVSKTVTASPVNHEQPMHPYYNPAMHHYSNDPNPVSGPSNNMFFYESYHHMSPSNVASGYGGQQTHPVQVGSEHGNDLNKKGCGIQQYPPPMNYLQNSGNVPPSPVSSCPNSGGYQHIPANGHPRNYPCNSANNHEKDPSFHNHCLPAPANSFEHHSPHYNHFGNFYNHGPPLYPPVPTNYEHQYKCGKSNSQESSTESSSPSLTPSQIKKEANDNDCGYNKSYSNRSSSQNGNNSTYNTNLLNNNNSSNNLNTSTNHSISEQFIKKENNDDANTSHNSYKIGDYPNSMYTDYSHCPNDASNQPNTHPPNSFWNHYSGPPQLHQVIPKQEVSQCPNQGSQRNFYSPADTHDYPVSKNVEILKKYS